MAPPSTTEVNLTPRCSDQSNSTEINSPSTQDAYEFEWTPSQQMNLIGFYYFGYVPCHLLGGSLAFKYGFKRVLMVSALGAAILSASFPFMARSNYWLAVANRVVLGILQVELNQLFFEDFRFLMDFLKNHNCKTLTLNLYKALRSTIEAYS